MKIQYELMTFLQQKQCFREVVSEALGGKKSKGPAPESYEEIASIIATAGGEVH